MKTIKTITKLHPKEVEYHENRKLQGQMMSHLCTYPFVILLLVIIPLLVVITLPFCILLLLFHFLYFLAFHFCIFIFRPSSFPCCCVGSLLLVLFLVVLLFFFFFFCLFFAAFLVPVHLCPLLTYLRFLFFINFFSFFFFFCFFFFFFFFFFLFFFFSSFSPSLSFSLCIPPSCPPPKKKNKTPQTPFCLYWQNQARFSRYHKNAILWGNIALCHHVQTFFFENPDLQGFRNRLLWTLTQIFRGHTINPLKQESPSPKNPQFYSVLLPAPLHESSTSRNHIHPPCEKRAVFQKKKLHFEEHHRRNTHNSWTWRGHLGDLQRAPNTYMAIFVGWKWRG